MAPWAPSVCGLDVDHLRVVHQVCARVAVGGNGLQKGQRLLTDGGDPLGVLVALGELFYPLHSSEDLDMLSADLIHRVG